MNNLYKYKPLELGIIILCPNLNISNLKNTISSADVYYTNNKISVILPENCNKEDLEKFSKLKKTYKCGINLSSMINCGIKNAPCPAWNFIFICKGWMRSRIDIKYSYFIENEKDILFPVTNFKLTNFSDTDINGLLIHKQSFDDIGDFPDEENLDISKLIWINKAMEKGYKFKGIVGAKIF